MLLCKCVVLLLAHLYEGDLYPVVGLNIEHLNPVPGDGEPAVILGDRPGDVDLVCDTVLVLRLCTT